jgi:hypothetical protein
MFRRVIRYKFTVALGGKLACFAYHSAQEAEAVRSSETSIDFYQITQSNIPDAIMTMSVVVEKLKNFSFMKCKPDNIGYFIKRCTRVSARSSSAIG